MIFTKTAKVVKLPAISDAFRWKGSCEKIREGEAPAEPRGRKLLIKKGSAGASPSRANDLRNFFTAPE